VCALLVAELSRKRPSQLLRGDLRIWAAAAIYAVGSVNFLFDRSQPLHLSGDALRDLTGAAKSTIPRIDSQPRRRDLIRIARNADPAAGIRAPLG
jgi:hypothetical protein